METIYIKVNGFELKAYLIREANPRLAICQERVALLDEDDNVCGHLDLLDYFPL